jgi:pimeloyl-ACP methyl ester carboxylesterase
MIADWRDARLREVEIIVTAADGTRLIACRTGHGTPVVLVHGSAGGLGSWDPVTPLLSDEFELWVYARRGYAPSDGSPRPKTYADDVVDLRAVVAAAGGSAHVVGGSYGATVALHAAAGGDGAALRSLTLFEPPLFAAGRTLTATLDRFHHCLEAGNIAAAQRLFADEVSRVPAPILAALADAGAGPQDAAEQAVAAAEAVGCLHDLEAMAADTADIRQWAHLDVPVLLMQGSDTWSPMPATMNSLAEVMPGAARAVLPGQSHFASHTAPNMFANAIREFLKQHDG